MTVDEDIWHVGSSVFKRSRSSSTVKVIGHRSRSLEEDVVTVVGATSSEGFFQLKPYGLVIVHTKNRTLSSPQKLKHVIHIKFYKNVRNFA